MHSLTRISYMILHLEGFDFLALMRGLMGILAPGGKSWPSHGSSITSATNLQLNLIVARKSVIGSELTCNFSNLVLFSIFNHDV
jgi:hypothetical protein